MAGPLYSGLGKKALGAETALGTAQQAKLTDTGGVEAAAYGYAPDAHLRTHAGGLLDLNDAQIQNNEARVNIAYGHLPSMRGNVFNQALGNNAIISGAIGRTTGLVRDADQAANVASSEADARQVDINSANNGLIGSSVANANKRRVLGTYLGGRSQVAANAGATRVAATDEMEKERLGTIDRVRGKMGADIEQQLASTNMLGMLGEAKRGLVPQAIGTGIEGAGNLYATNMLYNQMSQGTGETKLPSLSGGSTRATGGFTSGLGGGR